MAPPRKIAFVFGDITLTFEESDVDAVLDQWEKENPGKVADRDMSSDEFARRCVERIKANAKLTRTVIHN